MRLAQDNNLYYSEGLSDSFQMATVETAVVELFSPEVGSSSLMYERFRSNTPPITPDPTPDASFFMIIEQKAIHESIKNAQSTCRGSTSNPSSQSTSDDRPSQEINNSLNIDDISEDIMNSFVLVDRSTGSEPERVPEILRRRLADMTDSGRRQLMKASHVDQLLNTQQLLLILTNVRIHNGIDNVRLLTTFSSLLVSYDVCMSMKTSGSS
jgi:hypothetical protein